MKKRYEAINLFPAKGWTDYEMLDSGRFRKLERFGDLKLIRPEPRAKWKPALAQEDWDVAVAEFIPGEKGKGGYWETKEDVVPWQIFTLGMTIGLEVGQSLQIGIFPENYSHWTWLIERQIKQEEPYKILNLFGYTGIATLAAAMAGAEVTHVDSSRRAVRIGKENAHNSTMGRHPIRWIVDDAVKFVEKEIRRGNKYNGLILDPPQFGLGPKRERWRFSDHFSYFCELLNRVLVPDPDFVVLTAYELEAKPEKLLREFQSIIRGKQGFVESGYLCLQDTSAGRFLEMSQFIRWSRA